MKKMSKKIKKENPQFSVTISNFCNMVTDVTADYEWNKSEVNRLDRLTQDYLHQLELNNLDYHERARVATQLAKTRQLRRVSKDTVEILEPFMEFMGSDKGKHIMNFMREALGKTRKVESKMENRTYRYKVLSENE